MNYDDKFHESYRKCAYKCTATQQARICNYSWKCWKIVGNNFLFCKYFPIVMEINSNEVGTF